MFFALGLSFALAHPALIHPTALSAAPQQPVISRLSSGGCAARNETLIISGAGLAGGTALLCPLSGGAPCLSLPGQPSSWEGGLKVTLPSVGAFSLAVCNAAGACSNASQAQTFTVNAPRVSWILGTSDANGDVVEAGGVLRAFGAGLSLDPRTGVCGAITAATAPHEALSPGLFPPGAAAALATPTAASAATVFLCGASGCAPLGTLLASCYRLDVRVPHATPPGDYVLRVDNGVARSDEGLGALGREQAVTVTPPRALPASPVLTLGRDCADLPACLRALPASGGVVAVPEGVWDAPANSVALITAGVTVRGAGPASVLRWAQNTAAGGLAAALACVGGPALLASFTLLLTSPAKSGVVFSAPGGCRGEALNITVDTLDGYPAFGIGPAFHADAGSAAWTLTGSSLFHRGNCTGQSWPHNTAFTVWGSSRGLFANNTVLCYCQGHSTDSSSRIVFDGNAVFSLGQDSQGDGFSTFEEPFVLEHIYVGRSLDVGNPGAAKRWESMTLDGPGGAIFGAVSALSSDGRAGEDQVLTLAVPARASPYGSKNISKQFVGATVVVLFGPGLGGLARVKSFTPSNDSWTASATVTLSPPLLTRPAPGASWVAINPTRSGMTWEGNTYVNDTTWQLWAQATDVVLAGGYFQDFTGDVRNWPLFYQCPWGDGGPGGFSCAWQANVGVDFIGNTLRCVSGMNIITSDYAGQPPVNLTLGIGLTRRGNALLGGSDMKASGRTDDVLIEHTTFAGAVCKGVPVPAGGIHVAEGLPHVLIR